VRSIALSQVGGSLEEGKIHWETPLTHGPGLIARLLETEWPKNIVLNVNFPACPPDAVTGIEITRQGRRDQASLRIDERSDPWGMPYFWFNFERPPNTVVQGTDLAAVDARKISVTPLCLDLTHEATSRQLAQAFDKGAQRKRAAGGDL
jgi:5'-nucleotidase